MTRILLGTPWWVWLLLAYLLWSGLRAMRERAVNPLLLLIIPGVFFAIAATNPGALLRSTPGIALGAALGWWHAARTPVTATRDELTIPGTPVVLLLSLLLFAASYATAVLRAMDPGGESAALPLAAALAAGFGKGYFAARAANFILRHRRARPA